MMARLAEIGWGKADPSFRQFFTTQFIPGGTPEQHDWFNELQRISTSPANAARFMRAFNTIDVTRPAAAVRCPTLVLHSHARCARALRGGPAAGSAHPRRAVRAHRKPQPPAAGRARLAARAGCSRGVPAPQDVAAGTDERIASLSPRLLGLLELIAQGRDNAQIAAALGLSEKTVRNHITTLFDRLAVENRSQAIVLARENGLGQR